MICLLYFFIWIFMFNRIFWFIYRSKVFFLRDIVYFVLNFIDEYNKFRISSKFFFVYFWRFYNFVFDIWKLNCFIFFLNRCCIVCIFYEYIKLKISFKFFFDFILLIDFLILCLIDILKMNWFKLKSFRMVNRFNK